MELVVNLPYLPFCSFASLLMCSDHSGFDQRVTPRYFADRVGRMP